MAFSPGLKKQHIPIDFTGGLDTKSPESLVLAGSFLVLENCIRRKTKRVQKRYGFTKLGKTIVGTANSITAGKNLDIFQNDLIITNDNNLYSYVSSEDTWVDKGTIPSVLIDSRPIVRNSQIQYRPDAAQIEGLSINAWQDSRGGIRYSVFNEATNTAIVADLELSSSGIFPKVVALKDYVLITYLDSTDLKVRRISKLTPNILTAPQTVLTDVVITTNPLYDITKFNDSTAFFAYESQSNQVVIGYLDKNGNLGSPLVNFLPGPTTIGYDALDALTVYVDAVAGYNYISHVTNPTDVRVTAVDTDLTNQNTTTLIPGNAVANNITLTKQADGDMRYFVAIGDTSQPTGINFGIFTSTFTYNGATFVVQAQVLLKNSVGLVSKAFTQGDFEYVFTAFDDNLQPTYFLIRSDGLIVARILAGLGGGNTRNPSHAWLPGLSATVLNLTNMWTTPLQVRIKVQADNNGVVYASAIGLNRILVTIDGSDLNADTLGNNYHIASGILTMYDGATPVEHGFNVYPSFVGASAQATGGSLSAGNYQSRAIYEWVDAQGQVHRSIPSPIETVTTVLNGHINYTIPTLRLTAKDNTRAPVKVVLFRTAVNGESVFYRDVEIDNDTTANTVSLSATQADTTLTTKEILYTTGGALDNAPAPAAKAVHKHKNRLWLGALEDDNTIAYSKEHVYGEGVAFCDEFRIAVDPLGGGVLTLGSLDDKLIIFKKDRAFALTGDGPVDTGAQNDYGNPQLISGDVGCSLEQSIVVMPLGLMFKSAKGFFLLSRNLEVKYIGAAVEKFNDLLVTSGILIEDANEVRFTTSDGACIIYNYYFDQWSVFTNYQAESATNDFGSYMHLKADGTVNREIQGQYNDNGQTYKQAIETAWFSLDTLQGYQRIYWVTILGDFFSHHITKIQFAYDFETSYNETVYFNTQTGLAQTIYGEDTFYGESTPYAAGSSVYQFRCKPARQKCESIKIRLEDLDTLTMGGGGSFALTSLAFTVGAKSGSDRLGDSKTIGSA